MLLCSLKLSDKVRNRRVLTNGKLCNNAVSAWAQSGSSDDVFSDAEGISDQMNVLLGIAFGLDSLINVGSMTKVAN
jgi:hypothetical protein